MNSNLMQCDDSKLELLLAANDHDAEHDPWMHHVEQCSQCQSRLRELAAADDQWQKAAEVLATEEDDVSCFRGEHETTPNWNEAMVKQLLDPPSHPEMLGRLGRYEMERMIGSGGMGIVFKAFDTELNRVVAIKLLAPYLAARSSARKRFAREARAAAGVRDDHVVPIFNVESEHEPPFLVMQYVAGGSLQEKLDRDGPLEVAEVLRIGLQTAKGLAAAHAQGLIHRDVKPSNILLDEGVERALLTDFGLARAEDDACLTRSGFHPGTPHYMSPEQVRGDAIDGRSDLFSLGCVLYTLCTGRSPFRADTSYAVMRRITDEIPRPIRELNADIPQWLESIVMKLLSKTRDDRFSSADKVAELLEDCLAHVQEPTTRPLPASVAELVKDSFSADTGSKPTGLSGGFRFPPIRKLITAAAFAFIAFAGTIIYLETGKGTLRIESQADDVPIRIVRGNEVVEELTVSQSGQSVRIAAGTYEVEIGGEIDGLLLDKGKVVLSRGENEVVRIARTSGETAQVSGTPIVAPVPFDAPFKCRVRWGEGIYENAFVKKGELIGEVVEFDTDLLEQTENQLSAAKNQVNSMQAAVQANESNLSATETIIETLARQREAYEEVKSQIETAAAATLASAKNRIEAKKAELAEQAAVQEQTQTNFARQQELFEEALISKLQYQAAEHGVKVAGARVKKAQADIQSAENDLIARQSEDQAKKAKAQVDVDLAISSVDKAKGDAARAERELAKARRDLKQAQKTVVELETKLARQRKLLIHAPFSGFVTQLGNRIVNEGDRICLLSPEAADTQPAGQENASPGARGASDDVTISTLTEAPLGKITETLRAVFALGKRFQEIQTKLHAAVEGEESEQTIATLEEKKAAVRSERDMIVAILEAQLEAAEKRKESQTTVRQSVKLGVQQGLLDPPGLPAAELAVVMTAAEIRQLELLIQHCRSLGIDEVTASQDEKSFALSILSVRLEAEQKNHRFHMDRSTLAKRLFDLGDRDLYDVQEAEQAEAEVAAEVRKLEVLIEAYQNDKPNSIGLPPSLEQGTSISATPTIEEATRQFNLQSATDRETLFDPPIGELSVQQLRDAFAKTANEYREIGEHTIADSLQRIAETGQLPSDALSPVYASGPYGKDKDGKLTQKQIVPMLMLPDGRGGARLVPLRSAELIYNKHGRSSERYGDLFEESQQTSADGSDKKTGIEDRNTQNDSVSEELANAGESLAARAAMAVTKEGRQVLSDAVPGKLADRLVAAAGSPTWKLHHVDKLPTVLADDSLGYRITLRRTWEEYSSLPQQKETPPDERGPFELKHEDWEFVLFSRERQDAGRRSDASTPAANASRLAQSWLEVPGLKIIWKPLPALTTHKPFAWARAMALSGTRSERFLVRRQSARSSNSSEATIESTC
jgi:serine/threonine protein kinase